jgi:hypothetical protein
MEVVLRWHLGAFLAVIAALVLSACDKPIEAKRVSEALLQRDTAALEAVLPRALDEDDPIMQLAASYATDCGRAAWSGIGAGACAPIVASVLGVLTDPDALRAEQAIWTRYADEPLQTSLGAAIASSLEARRSALVAELAAAHWIWTAGVQEAAEVSLAQLATAVPASFIEGLPDGYLLGAQPTQLQAISKRLEDEHTILQELGLPKDLLFAETLEHIEDWQKRLALTIGASPPDLHRQIIDTANNENWPLLPRRPTPVSPEATRLQAAVAPVATDEGMGDFLLRGAAFNDLVPDEGVLRIAVEGKTTALTPSAANMLVDDCTTLLQLDETLFDEICALSARALQDALASVASVDAAVAGATPPPTIPTPPSSGPPKVDVEGIKALLRQRILPLVPTASPAAFRAGVLAGPLVDRIRALSAVYAEASYVGYFQRVIEIDALLTRTHGAMAAASNAPLPASLSDPLSLLALSPNAVQTSIDDTTRLERILEGRLALWSGLPSMEIALESLQARSGRLAKIQAAPPSQSDWAAAIQNLDPEKAKLAAAAFGPLEPVVIAQRERLWNEMFQGLSISFDDLKGPRGPPEDPKFSRSRAILNALLDIGRNHTEAMHDFAALRAEHAMLYDLMSTADAETRATWEFGRSKPAAWMASLLSPADLVRAQVSLDGLARTSAAVTGGLGWSATQEFTEEFKAALAAEVTMRLGPGHPPGYPPGRPPTARLLLAAFSKEWSQRPATALEAQYLIELAQRLYSDLSLLPAAVREDVREAVAVAVDASIVELEAARRSLSGADGLLNRAALSVTALTSNEMASLERATLAYAKAVALAKDRVLAAESGGYLDVESDRHRRLGALPLDPGIPPASDFAGFDPAGPRPSGPGFLIADAVMERSFVDLKASLQALQKNLEVAQAIRQRAVIPPLVGTQIGRAGVKRTNWAEGKFSFAGMMDWQDSAPKSRYAHGLENWTGFINPETGRPYHFERYVVKARSFDGVGGGIHFGSVSTGPEVPRGAALSFDGASGMLVLKLPDGASFEHGPVDPRVLKALYSYVSSEPGVNLAVTIGALGAGGRVYDPDGMPVMLAPYFVDTKVGQDLYLADTIPWSLGAEVLPNGSPNPASTDFEPLLEAYHSADTASSDLLSSLVSEVKPYASMTWADWESLPLGPSELASRARVRAAMATTWPEFLSARAQVLAIATLGPAARDRAQLLTKIMEVAAWQKEALQEFENENPAGFENIASDRRQWLWMLAGDIAPKIGNAEVYGVGELALLASIVADYQECKSSPGPCIKRELGMRALAVLFDESSSFELVEGRIVLRSDLKYRYLTSRVEITSGGMTVYSDGLTGAAIDIDSLGTAANDHFDQIVENYDPMQRVENYAALAAFLRWAACPDQGQADCSFRPGLSIDFSALGGYDLRDRDQTPTPDVELR